MQETQRCAQPGSLLFFHVLTSDKEPGTRLVPFGRRTAFRAEKKSGILFPLVRAEGEIGYDCAQATDRRITKDLQGSS